MKAVYSFIAEYRGVVLDVLGSICVILALAFIASMSLTSTGCAICETCAGWGPYAENGKIDDGQYTPPVQLVVAAWGFGDYTLKQNMVGQASVLSVPNTFAVNAETQAAYNAYFQQQLIQSLRMNSSKPVVIVGP